MKKKMLGTGNNWSLTITIGLALFILGIFGMALLFGNEMQKIIRQNFEVEVFLEKDLTEDQIIEMGKYMASRPYVAKENGKPSVQFITKEEAGKKFIKETGEDFSQFLGENPLRDAYAIKIEESFLSLNALKKIESELNLEKAVFEVKYHENLIGAIQDNIKKLSLISITIASLLLFTVIWLIRNTVKLSVFSQRFLIRTMELVGAEPWFIQKPYIVSMFWRGLAGGGLASLLLFGGLELSVNYVPQIELLFVPEKLGVLLLGLPFIGSIVGATSTYLIIRKFLGKKLDDLHIY
jgi:cell division transport system permease protein